MTLKDCYSIGRLGKPHGLKGEFRLELDVDAPNAYRQMQEVFLLLPRGLKGYTVSSLRTAGELSFLIGLEGVKTRSEAEALAGTELYYPTAWKPAADVPNPDEDRSWLEGYAVNDERHGPLGIVQGVDSILMQDQLVVDYRGTEILIPWVEAIVREVDTETQTVRTRLPDGLLEVFTNPGAPEED